MSSRPDAASIFQLAIAEHLEVVRAMENQQNLLVTIAETMVAALRGGHKILWCGNGGSAADAQHMAAEIVGRFRRNRKAWPSVALTTDTSVLTALANDFGYDTVFARQVEALATSGDVLVGLSTSGNSRSVLAAFETARSQGVTTVGFTGESGGKMAALADYLIAVPSRDTARIQETHILAGHMLCDWIELDLSQSAEILRQQETAGATAHD